MYISIVFQILCNLVIIEEFIIYLFFYIIYNNYNLMIFDGPSNDKQIV
jgi:hypothetical protein